MPRMAAASAIVALILAATTALSAATHTRRTIDADWQFRLEADTTFTSVNIPHTYNTDAYRTPNYYRGKAVYRKRLIVNDINNQHRYYLRFEAASKQAEVSVNGKHLCSHIGGFTAFNVDITEVIRPVNIIEVEVDNGTMDVIPLSADFTFWGGIYRNVWLEAVPKVHFDMADNGSGGVLVTTPEVSNERATVSVKAQITNDASERRNIKITNRLTDADGKLCATASAKLKLKPGSTDTAAMRLPRIAAPQLWSPERPYLYRLVTEIADAKSGEVIDSVVNKVGLRWYSFDGHNGFSLNGKPYKLNGVNRHQDQLPVGWAVDDEVHRRDIALIKESGANFLRLAHYPQDRAVLDACDEMGLLVWQEIPTVDYVPANPKHDDNCEKIVSEMVCQYRNHPSIILWGFMNEILLRAVESEDPEWEAAKQRTQELACRLDSRVRALDPTRPTVMAFHHSQRYNELEFNKIVDVVGWNLYIGWYGGDMANFERFCREEHDRYPDVPMIISEWGAGSDRRIHSDAPRSADFSIEYQQQFVEHYLPIINKLPFISGGNYWNFIDFNVASRQESMQFVNNKGLVDNNRHQKDVFYYFKSMWRHDTGVIHIATRDRQYYIGAVGAPQKIKVYSNAAEVELKIDGQSVGRKAVENCNAVFDVVLPEGTTAVSAEGIYDGRRIADATMVEYRALPRLERGEELAINVGSNCSVTSATSGLTWLADHEYQPGSWGYTGGNIASTTQTVTGTVDGPVYQTSVVNPDGYCIDAPRGTYEVELLFCDASHQHKPQAYLLDTRTPDNAVTLSRFDISICGRTVQSAFAPAENGTYLQAIRNRYVVENTNGKIEVKFNRINGNSMLSGIKIRRL